MSLIALNGPLLLNFQQFYYELLRQKEKAFRLGENIQKGNQTEMSDSPLSDSSIAESTPDIESQEDTINLVKSIQKRLRLIIEEQQVQFEMHVGTGLSLSHFRDSHYLMAALADEIFLNLPWKGAQIWQENMLEAQLFQVQMAGEQFFKKLDLLLSTNEQNRGEIALIYLFCLSFGFKGQFRDRDDEQKITWYMDQLYILVNGGAHGIIRNNQDHMVQNCYDFTLTEPPSRGLPDVKTWATWIGAVLLTYVFVTYVVWYKLSSEIHESINQIFEQARTQPLT
jgi:type VI secretion system protein ImpK